MNRWGGAILALAWLTAAAAPAQKLPLSMRQAVDLALEPDGAVRLQLAMEAIRKAEAEKAQARAALLPHVEAYLQYDSRVVNLKAFGVDFGIPGTPLVTPSKVGPFNVFDARARANQTVFSLSAIRRYQAAKAGLRATRELSESARDNVAATVSKAYLAALRADARLEAARTNVRLAEELLELARNQKEAGTGTAIEVTRAEVQLANERQVLLLAENERRRAYLELLRAIDLPLETELELTEQLEFHPLDAADAETALREALTHRADWKAQQQQEARARLAFSAAKWERLPQVSAFGDYGNLGNAINDSFPTRTYGFRLTVPVFDGGGMEARKASSGADLRRTRIQTADLRARIELEIRLALDALRWARQQVSVAEKGLSLAERELEQAQRRYRAGVATTIEVTGAQNRLARARDNHIAALYQYEAARLDFGSAIGKIREFLP